MVLSPRELAEKESKPIAVAWVIAARAALATPTAELTLAALATNFAWSRIPHPRIDAHLRHVSASFASIASVLTESSRRFKDVSMERAAEIFGVGGVPPAYAIFADHVYFTPHFRAHDEGGGFGPMCRAAMVVHESVHVFDRRSGEPEIHISEWDERFETLTPEQQLHNPSAYASFAAQVHERRLQWPRTVRFGAGNPAL
jgi:hypothetical protein